jgi:glyoxylase-like metal-dependent hydrolase (beta-lactamase superfamily II)
MSSTEVRTPAPMPLDRSLLEVVARDLGEAKAYDMAPGVWCLRLPVPYPTPRSVNAVLLDAADGKVLVDSGNLVGIGLPALEHALALAGSDLSEVSTLFCTHLHPDHAEAAPTLVERTGMSFLRGQGPDTATDKLHERSVPLAERRALAGRAGVPAEDLELMVDLTAAEHGTIPRRAADRQLAEGDAIETDFGTWELLPARGHSPNQFVLYERRRRWMIGADVAFGTGRPFFEWGNSPDPAAEFMESLERIGALPCEMYIPGHGPPDPDPGARFRDATDLALDWWRTVRAGLAGGPATPYEIVLARVGDDPDPDHRQSSLASVMAVLDHLVARGEAGFEEGGGVRRYALTATGRERLAAL